MRRVLSIPLLLLLTQAGRTQTATGVDALRDCLARANQQHDRPGLAGSCPDLRSGLEAAGLAPYLEQSSVESLDIMQLEALLDGLARYERPAVDGPATAHLAAIAAELNASRLQPKPSLLDRLKALISDWLSAHAPQPGGWLDKLAQQIRISPVILRIVGYLAMLTVIFLAVGLIVRELRALGLLKRRDTHPARSLPANRAAEAVVADAARSRGALSCMLANLVERLVATGRLRSEHALTHRELIAHSRFDSEEQRRTFAQLAIGAEGELYGARVAQSASIVHDAHELLAELGGGR